MHEGDRQHAFLDQEDASDVRRLDRVGVPLLHPLARLLVALGLQNARLRVQQMLGHRRPDRRTGILGQHRAGHGQQRVAHGLGVEPPRILAPEQEVLGIRGAARGVVERPLPIRRGAEDHPMQRLERSACGEQLRRQRIEQLRMTRTDAAEAEIIGRGHEPPPEVMVPEPVDDHSRGQRVLGRRHPGRQSAAAAGRIQTRGRVDRRRIRIEHRDEAGGDFLARLGEIPLVEQVGRGGIRSRIPHGHAPGELETALRLLRELLVQLAELLAKPFRQRRRRVDIADLQLLGEGFDPRLDLRGLLLLLEVEEREDVRRDLAATAFQQAVARGLQDFRHPGLECLYPRVEAVVMLLDPLALALRIEDRVVDPLHAREECAQTEVVRL